MLKLVGYRFWLVICFGRFFPENFPEKIWNFAGMKHPVGSIPVYYRRYVDGNIKLNLIIIFMLPSTCRR
jgi:hypothetical protein